MTARDRRPSGYTQTPRACGAERAPTLRAAGRCRRRGCRPDPGCRRARCRLDRPRPCKRRCSSTHCCRRTPSRPGLALEASRSRSRDRSFRLRDRHPAPCTSPACLTCRRRPGTSRDHCTAIHRRSQSRRPSIGSSRCRSPRYKFQGPGRRLVSSTSRRCQPCNRRPDTSRDHCTATHRRSPSRWPSIGSSTCRSPRCKFQGPGRRPVSGTSRRCQPCKRRPDTSRDHCTATHRRSPSRWSRAPGSHRPHSRDRSCPRCDRRPAPCTAPAGCQPCRRRPGRSRDHRTSCRCRTTCCRGRSPAYRLRWRRRARRDTGSRGRSSSPRTRRSGRHRPSCSSCRRCTSCRRRRS